MMAKQFPGLIVTSVIKAFRLNPWSLPTSHSITLKLGSYDFLCTVPAIRKHCSMIKKHDKSNDQQANEELQDLHKDTNESLIHTLMTTLSIDRKKALQIYHNISIRNYIKEEDITHVVNTLKEAGASISSIKHNLASIVDNMKSLERKISCLECLNEDINEIIPLLGIDLKFYTTLLVQQGHIDSKSGKNKIRYLADKLGCSVYNLCQLLQREPRVIMISINRIKTILNILKEFNYKPEEIMNNLWLFKYSPLTIQRRSLTMRLIGLNSGKPWLIRCSVTGFQTYTKALKKELQLNNFYGSHVQLLMSKLGLSKEEAEFHIRRFPNITNIQRDKIDEVLDILLKYEYSTDEILACPRIFLIRARVIEERLHKLHETRGQHRLSLLYSSVKVFNKTMEAMTKLHEEREI